MRKLLYVSVLLAAVSVFYSCDKGGVSPEPVPDPDPPAQDDGGFEEPVPDRPDYVNLNLIYYGGDEVESSVDYWVINLYTDMEVEAGYPVGPGQFLSLAVNAPYNAAQEPSLNYLAGEYNAPANSMDASEGTYVQGVLYEIEFPGETVLRPDGCFFGDIPAGTTDFEADLLREGSFTITDNGDGTFTVEGIMVGTEYMKRYFSCTGKFDPVDNSQDDPGTEIPNTNLTSDVTLDGMTQARLIDKGDYFFTGEDNYRLFLLYLAEPGVDLSQDWPSGTGRLLHLELFVPGDADPADGIPAGTYTMANRIGGTYMDKESIVPFRVVEGAADVFEYNTGTWYQEIDDGMWISYGRITGGTVCVDRDGDAHTLTIELTDCGEPAHRVSGVWRTSGPINL